MNAEFLQQIGEVVFYALANKYPISSEHLRGHIITPLLEDLGHLAATELPDLSDRVTDVQGEARNQIITLLRLDADWAERPSADLDLETIHLGIFGSVGGPNAIRTQTYVPDYGGIPPVMPQDVIEWWTSINSQLRRIDSFNNKSVMEKCRFLAELFSNIIAAHVFIDGNGRVARVAVQYCLRRWKFNFIPLPKVRNAEGWKAAVHDGVNGNSERLTQYIYSLISGSTIEQVESKLITNRQSGI